MLLWEGNNLVRRGLLEAPAIGPEKLQKETLGRKVSQESDRNPEMEQSRGRNAIWRSTAFSSNQMCWVLFIRPAGEPGRNHHTNLFQLLNEKRAEQNVPQLKKQCCTQWLFSWERCFWGGDGQRCGRRRPLLPTSGHWLFFSLEGEMVVLLCPVLFSVWSPSALCVSWAKTGRVEHWEGETWGEEGTTSVVSTLKVLPWRRSPSRLQAPGPDLKLCLDSVRLMWKYWVFWAGAYLPSGVVLLLWR